MAQSLPGCDSLGALCNSTDGAERYPIQGRDATPLGSVIFPGSLKKFCPACAVSAQVPFPKIRVDDRPPSR